MDLLLLATSRKHVIHVTPAVDLETVAASSVDSVRNHCWVSQAALHPHNGSFLNPLTRWLFVQEPKLNGNFYKRT